MDSRILAITIILMICSSLISLNIIKGAITGASIIIKQSYMTVYVRDSNNRSLIIPNANIILSQEDVVKNCLRVSNYFRCADVQMAKRILINASAPEYNSFNGNYLSTDKIINVYLIKNL